MTTYSARQDIAAELVAAISKSFDADRAARTTDNRPHVSEVIKCLKRSWRERQPGHVNTDKANPDNMTLLRGQAWDQIASRASSGNYFPHIQLGNDWLVGEADAVGYLEGDAVVYENKTTAAGTKVDAPERWPHYVEQMAAYCVLAQRGVKRAILSVLHLPMPTTLKTWDVKFTDLELFHWLVELKRRAEILLGDVEPTNAEHADWECSYCPMAIKKGGDCDGQGYGRPSGFFLVEQGED